MFKSLALTAVAVAVFASASAADAPAAQTPADTEKMMIELRDDMQAARADIVAKGIKLSSEQAAKFWPLFQQATSRSSNFPR
jgi:Spy/CpxP family protein refolding chaperone